MKTIVWEGGFIFHSDLLPQLFIASLNSLFVPVGFGCVDKEDSKNIVDEPPVEGDTIRDVVKEGVFKDGKV